MVTTTRVKRAGRLGGRLPVRLDLHRLALLPRPQPAQPNPGQVSVQLLLRLRRAVQQQHRLRARQPDRVRPIRPQRALPTQQLLPGAVVGQVQQVRLGAALRAARACRRSSAGRRTAPRGQPPPRAPAGWRPATPRAAPAPRGRRAARRARTRRGRPGRSRRHRAGCCRAGTSTPCRPPAARSRALEADRPRSAAYPTTAESQIVGSIGAVQWRRNRSPLSASSSVAACGTSAISTCGASSARPPVGASSQRAARGTRWRDEVGQRLAGPLAQRREVVHRPILA